MVYIDTPAREVVEDGRTVWPNSLYRLRVPGGDISETVRAISTATPALASVMPAFPAIANDGTIIYMKLATSSEAGDRLLDRLPEAWTLAMVGVDNNERDLTNGSHPHWLDEGSFLFFKNDGLYRYSLTDSTAVLVMRTLTPVTATHRFGLDNQGKQLWLIEPGANATRLFDVGRSNGVVSLKEKTIIMGAASSAVFSPEGDHIAIILVPGLGEEIGLPLIVYDTKGVEVHYSFLPYASLALTSLQAWLR